MDAILTSSEQSEIIDWLQLYRCPHVGPTTFYRLLNRFGDAATALKALPDLAGRGGARQTYAIHPRTAAEREYEQADRLGMRVLLSRDPRYPQSLRTLETAPLLYFFGNVGLLAHPAVAVVGSRDASTLGRRLATTLAKDCGEAGFPVISGLARGIDTAAHQGALATGTVAVLAGGLDIVYPRENRPLYDAIADNGCLLSEMPPATQPQAPLFPRRNRLVSGLAAGVVVIEAALRSGSLITARLALDQGREVFAVPGSPFDTRARGTNSLIKQGATLTESAADVLDVLTMQQNKRIEALPPARVDAPRTNDAALEKALRLIVPALSTTPVTVDEIIRQCQLSPAVVSMALIELELAGRLERHPGNQIALLP